MSIAGKCCFQDTVEIFGAENILNNYNVYIGDNILPLRMETEKDLIPYYPYLESLIYSDKETGGIIRLHEKSFIDEEEEESLEICLEIIKRYWKSCKRKKEQFDKEEALKRACIFSQEIHHIELVNRVEKFGDKANIKGIHDPYHEKLREELYNLMIKYGWNENQAYYWIYKRFKKI